MNAARLAPLALPLLLLACKDKDDESEGEAARDAYFSALCRLYTEEACTEAMSAECSFSISFESVSECETFLSFAVGSCDAAEVWMGENAALVQACADQVDAIECGADPICDAEGADVTTTGECAQVDAQLAALCSEDSG